MPFCPRCASEFDLSTAGGSCGKCGSTLPGLVQEPAERQPRASSNRPSRWKRLAASSVDLAFCALVAVLLTRVATPPLARFGKRPAIYFVFGLLAVLLPLAYGLMRDALGGKSVGKLLLGLTATRSGGRPAGVPESIVRNLPFGLLGLAVGLSAATPYIAAGIRGPFVVVITAVLGLPAALIVVQILLGHRLRLLDSWAGTSVVSDRGRL